MKVWHLCKVYEINVNLQKSDLIQQIMQEVPTCRVLRPKFRPYIEAYVLELTLGKTYQATPPLCFRQHGFHRLTSENYVFVAGNEVLGLPDGQEYVITSDVARCQLACDRSLTLFQAVQGFWAVLKRNRSVRLTVWAFVLLSSMRSLLTRMNITTYPSCSITGGQGFGKTTTCQRFALLYDDIWRPGRRWGEIDLKSTEAATVELINRYRDQVVLLDDGAKSSSPAEARQCRDSLAGALRYASNDTDLQRMDRSGRVMKRFCAAGLIYTAEYPLNNASDVSRTVTVSINQQLQGGEQQDRVYAATIFRYFILWLLPRVDGALASLSEELAQIEGTNQRLQKNGVMLLWALKQFLLFVQDSEVVGEAKIDKLMKKATQICDDMVTEQINQIEQIESTTNLSKCILEGIQEKKIKKVSVKYLQTGKPLPTYCCVRMKHDDEILCMTSDELYRYLTEAASVPLTSSKAMNKQLRLEGIIHPRKEGRSAARKIEGRRYLELRRADLIAAAGRGLR